MYRIIEKNLNNNCSRVFKSGLSKSCAEHYVREFNKESLFDDRYYMIESEDNDKK